MLLTQSKRNRWFKKKNVVRFGISRKLTNRGSKRGNFLPLPLPKMNLTPSVYEIRTTNTTQNIVVGALRAPTNNYCRHREERTSVSQKITRFYCERSKKVHNNLLSSVSPRSQASHVMTWFVLL
jgi:hypothetical protein